MSDPDSDPEAAAMAAAMGFSSFGGAPPAKKKRKFNPVTDAFVEGSALGKIDRGGKKGRGSGGNQIPLGKRRVFGLGANGGAAQKVEREEELRRRNCDEIVLDLDEDDDDEDEDGEGRGQGGVRLDAGNEDIQHDGYNEDEGEGPRYLDTSLPPPIEATTASDDGPAYIDTSLPPPASTAATRIPSADAEEAQAAIDRILASIQPPPPPPTSSSSSSSLPSVRRPSGSLHSYPPPSTHALPSPLPPPPGSNLPARPVFSPLLPPPLHPSLPYGFNSQGRGDWSDDAGSVSSAGWSKGERNPDWYVGYYDPSFNENPWARVERERGLQSVGTWVDGSRREGR